MGEHINDNKLVIIEEPKNIRLNLTKKVDNNLKHETKYIKKHNEFFYCQSMESVISQLLWKYKHGNDIREPGRQ